MEPYVTYHFNTMAPAQAFEMQSTAAAPAFGGIMFLANIAITMALILGFGEIILRTLARWFIYKKAKIKSYKALIPLYNTYNDVKLAWDGTWALIYVLAPLFIGLLGLCANASQSTAVSLFTLIGSMFMCVVYVIYCIKLSKAFGHKEGWAVGLIFLNTIFMLMIGLGASKYRRNEKKALPAEAPTEAPAAQ